MIIPILFSLAITLSLVALVAWAENRSGYMGDASMVPNVVFAGILALVILLFGCLEYSLMPDIEVSIEVYCAKCGNGLCNQTESTRGRYRGEPQFRVEPCERCLEEARDQGYAEGQSE